MSQKTQGLAGIGADRDVIIVGAGPVGLCLAIELGLRGNTVTLVERADARSSQPRAKTLNMRSLEHFRRWGVADAVRAASPIEPELPTDIIFQTQLYGKHIARLPNIYFRGNIRANDSRFSEPSEWVPQPVVEGILKAKAASLPNVSLHYGLEFTSATHDAAGVTVRLRSTAGEESSLHAQWLIGADGARSRVRELIGAKMIGRHAFAANLNMVLRIPELDAHPPFPRGIMHWIINPESPAVMGPIGDLWYVAKPLAAGATEITQEEVGALLEATIGRKVAFELLTTDIWFAHELIADRYRDGRVFLAGDACHLHPPFGGYGMNLGIADAVDLGWKLDAVLHGWGGTALLDSYEFERRLVHQWTIDEAIANYELLSHDLIRPGLECDTPEGEAIRARLATEVIEQKRREFHTIGLVLGYHYGGSPVIACDDRVAAPTVENYEPLGLCGALAPHFWLAPGISLYDEFGSGFTLLDRTGAPKATARLEAAAAALGVPLKVLAIKSSEAAKLYPSPLTLVRPDQHIAWRGDGADAHSATQIIETVTGRST